MLIELKKFDHFTKNIIFVFVGSSLASFLTLIYQLFIAHKFSPQDFAAFNTLIAIYMLVSNPLSTLQLAVAKYSSDFKARGEIDKMKAFISGLFKISIILAVVTFIVFIFLAFFIMHILKIDSLTSVYFLALLLALSWVAPVLVGGVTGS